MIAGRGAGYALLALAGVLFVTAVISGWSGAARFQGREADTRAVLQAASVFVVASGTFDHRDAQRYATGLAALTTGPLRAGLAGAAVDPVAGARERSITTHIESVSVTALSAHEATASVTAVQQRRWTSPAGATRARLYVQETVRQRVTCRLVREDGRWLVAELRLESTERIGARSR